MLQHEWDMEMAYFREVVDRLRALLAEREASLDAAQQALTASREEMWEDGRHVIRDLDDALDVFSKTQVIVADNRSVARNEQELHDLRRMLESPYFGRIDFYDEAEKELLNVYIGRRACMRSNRYDFYVYDWRSPIASMFYDFDCGPAQFESPQGTCVGEIRLKRQYHIENTQMRAMYDADAVVQDDILGSILSRQAGDKLRDIAQSIQREQNTAIRFVGSRHMLVLGPAGSGKTSVGLHRMAYLLYHKRDQLTSADICVVSANHAFSEYISGILPDLYEADLRRTVFADLFSAYVPAGMHVGTYFEQVEYLLCAAPDDVRVRWIRALYSKRFLDHLRGVVDAASMMLHDITIEGEIMVTRAQAEDYLRSGNVTGYRARLQRAEHLVRQTLEDAYRYDREKYRGAVIERVQNDELDILDDAELDAYLDRRREEQIFAQCDAIRRQSGFSASNLLFRALREYDWETQAERDWIEACVARFDTGRLYYEDWIALLCARACMGEIEPMIEIRYVLIDEAQDYGAPQHLLLRTLFPRASFTLLADPGQVVLPQIAAVDGDALVALYPEGMETFHLHKSYRFTGPIGALAAELIATCEPISYYEREGKRPVMIRTRNAAREIRSLLDAQPYAGSTAILTVTQAAAERLYIALDGAAELLVESGDAAMGRTAVMPLYMSKGLEFDRVIIGFTQGDGVGAALERSAYYLMCTRALHELILVCEGEIPSVLSRCEAQMDVREAVGDGSA